MGFTHWTVEVELWLTASREKPESAKGNDGPTVTFELPRKL